MFLSFRFVIMSFFSSRGWESWDIANRPLIPERMPVLVDDDLLFEDGSGDPRPSVAVNQWLRELPSSGAPSPATWEAYARAVKEWMEFLGLHGVGVFDSRERLKAGLSRYAEHRAAGPGPAAVLGHDVGPAHEHPVAVLPVGDGRGPRAGRAFHLPDGAGAVRRDGPRGPGEPGGAADARSRT